MFWSWLWTCELMAKVMPVDHARKEYNNSISVMKQVLNKTWMVIIECIYINVFKRTDLFQLLQSVDRTGLDVVQERILETYLTLFRRNGASLEGEPRKRFDEVNKELTELTVKFLANVNEDTSKIILSKDELEGLPEHYFKQFKQTDDGKYIVTMKYPDVLPTMKLAKKETTRKAIQEVFDSRSPQNLPILFQVLQLRQGICQLLED